ncbi:MAG: TetR/AcrR family transcriptional regulator [Pseudomonadota bacterium]
MSTPDPSTAGDGGPASGSPPSPLLAAGAPLPAGDFASFKRAFPYRGRALYEVIFARHSEQLRTKKAKFAVSNLEKIFSATFKLSNQIGFQAMSLRQLSSETGISMGGLYSCLSSKEDIVLMAKALVEALCQELIDAVAAIEDPVEAMETALRQQVYATQLLQPWFSFLYFETRSLPRPQQDETKNIELRICDHLQDIIVRGQAQGQFRADLPEFAASSLMALIQDGYLKPWKWRAREIDADRYADGLVDIARRLLR